jgi:hypothetical protein
MDSIIALLEMRECYEEEGSASVYIRDIDGRSNSFGVVLSASLTLRDDGVTLHYKVLEPGNLSKKVLTSPYYDAPTKQVEGLADLAEVEVAQATAKELSIDLVLGGETTRKHCPTFQASRSRFQRNSLTGRPTAKISSAWATSGTNAFIMRQTLLAKILVSHPSTP